MTVRPSSMGAIRAVEVTDEAVGTAVAVVVEDAANLRTHAGYGGRGQQLLDHEPAALGVLRLRVLGHLT